MFNSLKHPDRIRLTSGKVMVFKPASAGRDGGASSEPKELDAIAYALSIHQPLYLVQHANGIIFDVLTDKSTAINFRDATIARTPNGLTNVKLFEQRNGHLFPVR